MTINQLKAFLAVCSEMNYTAAAEKLFISRQALRQNISALEAELDTELFSNNSNRISLTQTGMLLYTECSPVVEAFDAMETAMYHDQKLGRHIVIAVSHALVPDYLPELKRYIESFARREHIHISLSECMNDEVYDTVGSGRADCGLVMDLRGYAEGFERQELTNHSLCISVSNRHRLWGRSSVNISELCGEKLCVPGLRSGYADIFETAGAECLVKHSYYQVYYNVRENNYLGINRSIPEENTTPEHTADIPLEAVPPLCSSLIMNPGADKKLKELGKYLKERYNEYFK